MGFALQKSEDRYEMYWTQLQVASFENNFLEEPSFLLSSFGIVVHMLNLYIIYSIESCATAVPDVSNPD